MAEEFVTKPELKELVMEIRAEMADLKSEMVKNTATMIELKHSIDMMKVTSQSESDARYLLKDDLFKDARCFLDDPVFKEKCESHIKKVIDKHLENTRDNWSKWIKFAETIIKVMVVIAALYGGTTLINTQKSNQRSIMQGIERIGD